MTDSLGGRLRDVLTTPDPAISATAVVLALPAAYVAVAATGDGTLGFFALLLVGVRVPWLADPDVDAATGDADAASAAAAGNGSAASTPRVVLWAASTAVVVAAAFLGLHTASVALGVSANVSSAVAFFVAWVLVEPVVGGLDE